MLILFVHRTCRPREPSRDPERRARRHARGVGRDPFVSRRSPLNETAVSLHTHESHTVLHTRCYTHHVTQTTRSTTLCYTMCSVAVWSSPTQVHVLSGDRGGRRIAALAGVLSIHDRGRLELDGVRQVRQVGDL